MDVQTPRGAIVVGVDSSPDSDLAVRWALHHARHGHLPVHLVHVQPPPPPYVGDDSARERWRQAGQDVLDRALAETEHVRGVPVTSESLHDAMAATPDALLQACAEASLLVVGARGHGELSGLLIGSVSQYAVRHAPCPVVTVRVQADPEAQRVVVGVDASEVGEDALALAFELAAQRRASLTAIRAWHTPSLHGVGVTLPMPSDVSDQLTSQKQVLGDQLLPWELKYPAVRVTREVVPGHPGEVLTHASERAALVVVGSRGRSALTGMLLGSVSQEVLRHAKCPVAVSPPPR